MVKIRKTNTKINKSKLTVEIRGGKFLGKNPTLPWDVEEMQALSPKHMGHKP